MKRLAMLLLLTMPAVFIAGPTVQPAHGCELLKRLLHHCHVCHYCGGHKCHWRKCHEPKCHCRHGRYDRGRHHIYGYAPPTYGRSYVEPAPPAYEEIAPPGRTF